jgi:hypoxanthine phosphoribosyltransferase
VSRERKRAAYFVSGKNPLGGDDSHSYEMSAMLNDIERTLFHEQTIFRRLDELGAQITRDYDGRDITVIAVLNGSILFVADLMRRIQLPLRLDCIRVSSYHGGTESSGTVTYAQTTLPDVEGRHVLILDDILDTGRTLHAIRRRLNEEAGALSVRICVLLRKAKARAEELDADYAGFDIGDEFVVGYGLDYMEQYRNLPFIGVLKPGAIEADKVCA